MKFLLDTNVISETRKPRRNPGVDRWISRTSPDDMYLSVVTIGEIATGVERKRRRDPQQAEVLEDWLGNLQANYEDRMVDVDLETALLWGHLAAEQPVSPPDGLIAATALVRGWTLVTRNTRHVERTGVKVINPFDD